MRILNLVKYDFYSIFKSPLTYLAILVVSSLIALSILMANSMDNPKHIIVYGSVFAAAKWLLLIIGLMFVVKTITRDFSQGTIQLYMRSNTRWIHYFENNFNYFNFNIICINSLCDFDCCAGI